MLGDSDVFYSSVWEVLPDSGPKHDDMLFEELMRECSHNPPGARLSMRIRTAIEKMSLSKRRALCSRQAEGCAPLLVAARRGALETVEYLVHVCGAELEQRGRYVRAAERGPEPHVATALWCAAVEGHVRVVAALADAGACLDAISDSGSTPVRSACFMTHYAVVRELVLRGADIHRPNYTGGTCLINSIQAARLCRFLLNKGADVNATDSQNKTALHYAVQEHRLETVEVLLDHGANPFLKSVAGDDALRTAALRGAAAVLCLLQQRVHYAHDALADAYELLGATQLIVFNDRRAMLNAWAYANALRDTFTGYVPKTPRRPPQPWTRFAREWRTSEEFDASVRPDRNAHTQALLIAERVLGEDHKEFLFRLMYRGATYIEEGSPQQCIEHWTWALKLRLEKDSLLSADVCQIACALTKLMLESENHLGLHNFRPEHESVVAVYQLLADHLPIARSLLSVRPVHKQQVEVFDSALRCVTHLIFFMVETASTEVQMEQIRKRVYDLVQADFRSAQNGDTLLHLCASRLNIVLSTYFSDRPSNTIFPSTKLVELLIECGASVTVTNNSSSTALHVAAIPYNYQQDLVAVMLGAGGHVDQPNQFGDTAGAMMALNKESDFRLLDHVTLKCMAARALLSSPPHIPNDDELPAPLVEFLDLHRP